MAFLVRKRGDRRLAILWRFLTVYILLLFLPLLAGGIIYGLQIRDIEADIRATNADNLALNKAVVEAAIRDITTTINSIRSESRFAELLAVKGPLDPPAKLAIGRAREQSLIATAENPYLIDIVVYLTELDIVVTSRDVFFSPEFFYDRFYHVDGLDFASWRAEVSSPTYVRQASSFRRIEHYGLPFDVIEIRESLPYTPRVTSRGSMVAIIDRAAIEVFMGARLLPGRGFAYIEMDDGRTFLEVSYEDRIVVPRFDLPSDAESVVFREVDGRSYAVTSVRSSYNGWLYVAAVPSAVFLQQSKRIESIFFALAVLVVVIGIPVAVVAAYRFSKPLIRVSEILKDGVVVPDEEAKGGLAFISESVSRLIERNSSLRELLDEQKPYVRNVVIERLFRGEFTTDEEIRAFIEHFDVDMEGGSFGVACVFIDGYYDEVDAEILKEFIIKNTLIRKQLASVLSERALIHEISLNRIGVVVVLEASDGATDLAERFASIVRNVSAHLSAQRDVRCIVAEGGIVHSLREIPAALSKAIVTINSTTGETSVTVTSHDPLMYQYPPEVELRIINLALTGRVEELGEVIDSVRDENFVRRSLPLRMLKSFAREIEGTRVKIMNRAVDLPGGERFASTGTSQASLREEIESRLDGFLAIARDIASRGKQNHRFKKPIADYIAVHYMDPEMSLKQLALEFKLSEVYLSKLWRELFGTNFFSYIEELRLGEAAKLLKAGKMTVDQIAQTVGYNSAHAFRRAFKRSVGVSPSSYR